MSLLCGLVDRAALTGTQLVLIVSAILSSSLFSNMNLTLLLMLSTIKSSISHLLVSVDYINTSHDCRQVYNRQLALPFCPHLQDGKKNDTFLLQRFKDRDRFPLIVEADILANSWPRRNSYYRILVSYHQHS